MNQVRIPSALVRTSPVTPTGGGKTYTRQNYAEHGRRLMKSASETQSRIYQKLDSEIIDEVVYTIATAQDSPIKESRHRLKSIGVEIIQIDPKSSSIGVAVSSRANFTNLIEKIEQYASTIQNRGKSYFAAIEKIDEVDPIDKIDHELTSEGIHNCIIYLYSQLSADEQRKVLQAVSVNIQSEQEVDSKFLKTSVSGLALTARLTSAKIIELAKQYNSIRQIKLNSSIRLGGSRRGDPIANFTAVNTADNKVLVAVLDSGINEKSPYIAPFFVDRFADFDVGTTFDMSHGTFVASRIIYGDNIIDQVTAGILNGVCNIIDIPVFYRDARGRDLSLLEGDIIDILNNFIDEKPSVKLFNLSFGITRPIQDRSISSLANEIDAISKKHDKTFIIAAGNIHHDDPLDWKTFPVYCGSADSRITPPSEALLAITVGSYATQQNMRDIALPNQISPFSRNGPGMDGGIKPELVSSGGNSYVNARNLGDFNDGSAAVGIDDSGNHLAYDVGTSFAAPIVTHYASQVLASDPSMSSNLLKAYLIHFATNIGLHSAVAHRPDHKYGFGEFQFADFIGHSPSKMAFFYEGHLDSENYLHIPFHIPRAFDTMTTKRLKLKFTVVHDPAVDGVNPSEYSLSDILFELSKRDGGSKQKVSGSNKSVSKYSSKWNPVIKYERVFDRKFSSGEWEIRLRLNTRGSLEDDYKQTFAIIVECIDETNSINIHTEFMSDYAGHYSVPTSMPGDAI